MKNEIFRVEFYMFPLSIRTVLGLEFGAVLKREYYMSHNRDYPGYCLLGLDVM
jgi:hypothetical protein